MWFCFFCIYNFYNNSTIYNRCFQSILMAKSLSSIFILCYVYSRHFFSLWLFLCFLLYFLTTNYDVNVCWIFFSSITSIFFLQTNFIFDCFITKRTLHLKYVVFSCFLSLMIRFFIFSHPQNHSSHIERNQISCD